MRRPPSPRSPLALAAAGLAVVLAGCTSAGGGAAPTTGAAGSTGSTTPGSTTPGSTSRPPSGTGAATSSTLPIVGGPGKVRLLATVGDCDALLTRLKDLALAHVTAWGLDAYGPYYGGPMFVGDSAAGATATTAAASMTRANETFSPKSAAPAGSSGTNVQEQGVDEGDQVENDGRHVYTALDGSLHIVDTVSGEVTEAPLSKEIGAHQLVLDGDRLVVVSSGWGPVGVADSRMPYYGGGYGTTTVTVFDVSTPMTPKVAERRRLDGTAVAVRSADGTVRVVLSATLGARLGFVQPAQGGEDVARKAKALNEEAIRASTIDDWLPRAGEAAADGTVGDAKPAVDCDAVSLPTRDSGLGMTWVASVAADGAVRGSAAVVAAGGTTYASAGNLYVSTVEWRDPSGDPQVQPVRPAAPQTAIHQFALGDGGDATYAGSGVVPGTLLNAYSMSEHEGVLRVATTSQSPDGSQPSSSAVRTLRVRDGELTELGAVMGLGVTEQIYAVRFVGPTAYVVTFRRTDPLYVVDLRDPAAPKLAGELKVPGYSAYLHPLGDGRLIGIGQNATDDGRVLGLQVSLFDTSDPAAPVRLANLELGGASGVEWDPHAFLYWEGTGTAFVPLLPWWGGPDQRPDQQGLAAVTVDGDTLRLAGKVLPPGVGAGSPPEAYYTNMLQRALVVGGKLVALAPNAMRIADVRTLATVRDLSW
jgi:Beta propeller domain